METWKKFKAFFAVCFFVLGALGSIGWLIFSKAWAILIGDLVVIAFGVPTFVKQIKELIEG